MKTFSSLLLRLESEELEPESSEEFESEDSDIMLAANLDRFCPCHRNVVIDLDLKLSQLRTPPFSVASSHFFFTFIQSTF